MKLVLLGGVCFVLVATTTLITFKGVHFDTEAKIIVQKEEKVARAFPAIPILSDNSNFPQLSAQSVLALDVDSQVSMFEKNASDKVLPASTTKIVTALVAMDYYSLSDFLTVGRVSVDGQKMNLVAGEEISVRNLLYGLLVYSANDAAEVLAQNYPGGREAFILSMNEKTSELSLTSSSFSNPTGLDGSGHVTTAKDLARVSEYAMRNSTFRNIVGTKETVVQSRDGKFSHKLVNINELLGKVDGVLGVKTGWTENARENLVTYIERDGRRIIIVVLGSQDRFGETESLIKWIFSNFKWEEVTILTNKSN